MLPCLGLIHQIWVIFNAKHNWRNNYPDDDAVYFERHSLSDNQAGDDDVCSYHVWGFFH